MSPDTQHAANVDHHFSLLFQFSAAVAGGLAVQTWEHRLQTWGEMCKAMITSLLQWEHLGTLFPSSLNNISEPEYSLHLSKRWLFPRHLHLKMAYLTSFITCSVQPCGNYCDLETGFTSTFKKNLIWVESPCVGKPLSNCFRLGHIKKGPYLRTCPIA